MDRPTTEYYSRHAGDLRLIYANAMPENSDRLARAFEGKQKILDIGCGTGRDLAILLRKGKDAYGVDAVKEMLDQAVAHLQSQGLKAAGRLFQGELPDLHLFADGEFDGILCSAVLMHLPEEAHFDAAYSLRRLLKAGGILVVSLPVNRGDVDPSTRRDANGRYFADLPSAKLQLLLERIGFLLIREALSPDTLGRENVTWWTGEFRLQNESGERPLHLVESILNRDKKDATYKLALFRALAEIAQTQAHLAAYLPEGKVKVPLATIAEKWILYYWPIFAADAFLPQRTNESKGERLGVAIRKPLDELIRHFRESGGLTAFYCDWKSGKLGNEAGRLFRSVKAKFQSIIHTMPAKHAGGGHYDVFQYDALDRSLLMDVALWRELCLMGSWIRDATILRWAEQTEIFAKGRVKASSVIDCLLLAPDQGRNVNDAQKYFKGLDRRPCVWSHRELSDSRFDVDHAMPFSLWRNNDLWNLFPADPAVNARKSDKLPTHRQLKGSGEIIIDYWRGLQIAMGERFEREAQTLLGRDSFSKGNWENLLFNRFVEAFEVTAVQRGAERWETSAAAARDTPAKVIRLHAPVTYYPEGEEGLLCREAAPQPADTPPLSFHEVRDRAFRTHLPLLGAIAAGGPFHGFESESIEHLETASWIEVPHGMARKNRYVIRVAGDSMAPTFQIGDLLVFEYHRSPRTDRQIVIANLPEFGPGHIGTEAVKRITQDATSWQFHSDNPVYQPIIVPKAETNHPILGTFVGKVDRPETKRSIR